MFTGLADAFTITNIIYVTLGITIGYIVGAIPGLGKVTAAAIAIPLTFTLTPVSAIAFLVGISKGSTAGNAVSAILINTPGEPSSVPTAVAGYPLAQKGQGRKAIKVSLIASTMGDFLGTLALIALTAPLADLAVQVGRVELASILIFALTFIAALSGKSFTKGLISGLLGLMFSAVRLEIETGTPRMTFGVLKLYEGISLVAIAIGMVAIAEMVVQVEKERESGVSGLPEPATREDETVSKKEFQQILPPALRGTVIGTFVGILPGLGSSIASFASFGFEQRKDPAIDKGEGSIRGVAAAEAADNAVVPSSLIPLFTLGIPGSAIAAILAAGFGIHGVFPGPGMLRDNAELIAGVYWSMIIASIVMLAIGWLGIGFFSRIMALPLRWIVPGVFFFSLLGASLDSSRGFGIRVMVIFALFGYFVKKFDYSFVTFLIGFIIGPEFELTLRQAIIISRGDSPLDYPVAIAFGALTVIVVLRMIWNGIRGASPTEDVPAGDMQADDMQADDTEPDRTPQGQAKPEATNTLAEIAPDASEEASVSDQPRRDPK